jgi:hypothetical protein
MLSKRNGSGQKLIQKLDSSEINTVNKFNVNNWIVKKVKKRDTKGVAESGAEGLEDSVHKEIIKGIFENWKVWKLRSKELS